MVLCGQADGHDAAACLKALVCWLCCSPHLSPRGDPEVGCVHACVRPDGCVIDQQLVCVQLPASSLHTAHCTPPCHAGKAIPFVTYWQLYCTICTGAPVTAPEPTFRGPRAAALPPCCRVLRPVGCKTRQGRFMLPQFHIHMLSYAYSSFGFLLDTWFRRLCSRSTACSSCMWLTARSAVVASGPLLCEAHTPPRARPVSAGVSLAPPWLSPFPPGRTPTLCGLLNPVNCVQCRYDR